MTTLDVAAPPARHLTGAGLAVLLLGYGPVNFTFGAVNLLVPAITDDLSVTPSSAALVLSAYTTTFAAGLVVSGRLGDRYGRRRLFATGLASFTVLAALTGLAQGLVDLVVLRAALGLAAGLFTPQVLATIQATAPTSLRARGVIMFTATAATATILGQLVAGAVATVLPGHLGWRAVQLVTAVLAAAALPALRTVPESRSEAVPGLDLPGATLLAAGLVALVVPLTTGPGAGWPAWSVGLLVVAAVLLALFAVTQLRAERRGLVPVVPPSVLRVPSVRLGLGMTLIFFAAYGALLYELAEYASVAWGAEGWRVALLVLGFGIAFTVTALVLTRILQRTGPRLMVWAGTGQAVVLVGIALVVWADGGPGAPVVLQPLLVALGIVQAMMFGPALHTVLQGTPTWAAGAAGGLLTTMQQLGLGLGVAVLGGLFHVMARAADGTQAAAATGSGSGLAVGLSGVLLVHAVCAVAFAVLAARVVHHTARA
ncbi:MFS transporter [Promicromonospora citrea]|uniref:MFS transporter n=1 Tax=Promicromonospora citrea TaxID=43677 RepID=A0A8H9L4U9_9MICO|nr:MFS transporter [Promicromonospora citrea]NNH50803.1 MFS transporter [Promicromonospora citrea]GGM35863.1 MFS transporter [Promicromonospora citrea]